MIKNVLFITADQWRGECLSALKHHTVKTPNLDKLAREGILFSQHFAQATPCSPSRASIHTGMYQMNHRVCRNGTPLDARFTNLALCVREKGYTPQLFGYTDTALDPRAATTSAADKHSYETVLPGYQVSQALTENPTPWLTWLTELGYSDIPNDKDFMAIYRPLSDNTTADKKGASYAPPRYKAEHTETAFLRQKVENYISEQQETPWFIHLSWLRPHPPFVVPEPYNSMYDPDTIGPCLRHPSIKQEMAQHPYLQYIIEEKLEKETTWNVADGTGLKPDMSDKDLQQLKATYFGMMTEVDHQFGLLYQFLEENDHLKDTLIVFTSDHGEQLGDHYLLDKQGFFDQSYHIPLIIRAPDDLTTTSRGKIIDRFTENIDIMPTILDLLTIEIPQQCDGYSLKPFIDGSPIPQWREAVHWEHDYREIDTATPETRFGINLDECSLAVIRDKEFKYVHFNQLPALLFDLKNDPAELTNLANDSKYLGKTLEYAQKMLNWRMRNAEKTLTGWHYQSNGPVVRAPLKRNTHYR